MAQIAQATTRTSHRCQTLSCRSASKPAFKFCSMSYDGRRSTRWLHIAQAEKEPASQAPTQQSEEEDLPPWIRREKERQLQAQQPSSGFPWPLYLLFSLFTAIAAVGSFFEYANQNPIFGVVGPESPLYTPILGIFALTGLPMTGFLFYKGVEGANKAAELQDKLDGYMD